MPKWTQDQNEAIVARHSNLLVSAAAGSGKTAVLVERIIQLVIEDQISIDRMLIVTFTNAAASEMRERIIEALYEKLEDSDDRFLKDQIGKVQNAYIMTLHAFCIGVIRNNAHFIELDPGFKVGDTVDLNIMLSEAMAMTLEDAYEKGDPAFYQFVESFSENRADKKLEKIVMSAYQFIQSQPDPKAWFDAAVEQLSDRDNYEGLLRDYLSFHLSMLTEVLELAAELTQDPAGPHEYQETIELDQKYLEHLQALVNDNDYAVFIEYIRTLSHPRLKAIKKARKEEVDTTLLEEVKALRSTYKDTIKELQDFFEHKDLDAYLADLVDAQAMMQVLSQLTSDLSTNYLMLKTEKNLVDFNDLEHFALKALAHEEVRAYYRDRFEHIFLDEYQDSNLVQETLIATIKRENNVFLVGDVKQSIYRFRLADPSLFMFKYDSFEKQEGALNRRIDLKKNFRSRAEILEGINFIFESLMSKTFGEMLYDTDARLYPGLDFKPIDHPSIDVKVIETQTHDDLISELTAAELEAIAIAREIKALVGQNSYDRKRDCYFKLEYRHMVILMRAVTAWTPVFADIFMQEGVPLYADSQAGYFDTIELKMFVDLLRIIDNPLQDLPLLSVLRSPIFSFTTDEIIAIRTAHQEGHYFEALKAYNQLDALYDKLQEMQADLNRWRKRLLFEPLDEVLWSIMMETGYFQYVGAMPGGQSRQGNLRLLVDRAGQYGQSRNLFGFLQLIDKMATSNTEMGTAKTIGESENVVRIMSIHKSKGLEFPVVILAAMGKKFNLRDAYQDVLFHKHIGLGPKWVNPELRTYYDSLPKKLIKHAIKYESLSEEMRILYVALTRAVDKLILVGNVKDLVSSAKKWTRGKAMFNLMAGQSYLDWVMSIVSNHPAFKSIWDFAEKPYQGLKDHKTQWRMSVLKHEELVLQPRESKVDLEAIFDGIEAYVSEEMSGHLDQQFDFKYQNEISSRMPSKFTVTELKKLKVAELEKLQYKVDALNTVPNFLKSETKRTKAEIGTLMHFVMQKLDRKSIDTIEKQIQQLHESGILKEDALADINIKQIHAFFNSELGQRYQAAPRVFVEKPFVLKKAMQTVMAVDSDDEIMVQGIIDCYFEEDDGYVLVDYKTDYIYGDEQILEERYREQLALYKEAIEKITNKPVKEAYIYSFFKGKSIPVSL